MIEYIKNNRFERSAKKEISQYFFNTGLSAGVRLSISKYTSLTRI